MSEDNYNYESYDDNIINYDDPIYCNSKSNSHNLKLSYIDNPSSPKLTRAPLEVIKEDFKEENRTPIHTIVDEEEKHYEKSFAGLINYKDMRSPTTSKKGINNVF